MGAVDATLVSKQGWRRRTITIRIASLLILSVLLARAQVTPVIDAVHKGRRLELRPGAEGIQAVWVEGGAEVRTEPVDLSADPQELARLWLIGA